MPESVDPAGFWRFAFAFEGTATPRVLPRILTFTGFAAVVTAMHAFSPIVAIPVGPIEVSGAALALMLILRTNAGYERWWEGRKLWGGIVNQCRNLAIAGVAYGPDDPSWREQLVRWTAAFPHATRRSLRGQRDVPELAALLGTDAARQVSRAQHMPSFVARELASLLGEARRRPDGLDGFAFLEADRQCELLIDDIGACERIHKTPLAYPYAVMIRRFIVVYLVLVPFGLVASAGWATPAVTLFIAAPILALDHIGTELQNPFSESSLGHLPLDEICSNIEANLFALLTEAQPGAPWVG
jgi:putative membrane protein